MPGRTWRASNAGRWIHTLEGGAQPGRMNSHASALAARSRKGPQGATPGTRPPAPHPVGRRPKAAWRTHNNPRTLVPARSVKSTSLSNPQGPRRGCAAGQHAQHFGPFIPRRKFRMEASHLFSRGPSNPGTAPAPFPSDGYPQPGLPRVTQSVLGPARLVPTAPHTQFTAFLR